MKTEELLASRRQTHGDFRENALISQAIKTTLRASSGWAQLSLAQQESLDMIALKISRIVSGRSNEADHWDDIMGYARLGAPVPESPKLG